LHYLDLDYTVRHLLSLGDSRLHLIFGLELRKSTPPMIEALLVREKEEPAYVRRIGRESR
jgi:hypothetical protein